MHKGVLAIKNEDRNSNWKDTKNVWYQDMMDFARLNFDIEISEDGQVTIDGVLSSKYDPNKLTKEEIFRHYAHSITLAKYASSKFYSVYIIHAENKLV